MGEKLTGFEKRVTAAMVGLIAVGGAVVEKFGRHKAENPVEPSASKDGGDIVEQTQEDRHAQIDAIRALESGAPQKKEIPDGEIPADERPINVREVATTIEKARAIDIAKEAVRSALNTSARVREGEGNKMIVKFTVDYNMSAIVFVDDSNIIVSTFTGYDAEKEFPLHVTKDEIAEIIRKKKMVYEKKVEMLKINNILTDEQEAELTRFVISVGLEPSHK